MVKSKSMFLFVDFFFPVCKCNFGQVLWKTAAWFVILYSVHIWGTIYIIIQRVHWTSKCLKIYICFPNWLSVSFLKMPMFLTELWIIITNKAKAHCSMNKVKHLKISDADEKGIDV